MNPNGRVKLDSGHTGTVVGFYNQYAIVELDHGFFSEDGKVFISNMLVHHSNIKEDKNNYMEWTNERAH